MAVHGESLIRRFLYLHGRDNFTERIVHSFTIWILLFFTILLCSNMLFGAMLICKSPKEAPETWSNYFDNVCYYQDKYKVDTNIPESGRIPHSSANRYLNSDDVVTYYQWIPYSMILQIVLCILPALIWKHIGLRFFHGADFDAIIRGFMEKMPGAEKGETIKWISDDYWKTMAKNVHRMLKLKKSDRFGLRSTMILYVIQKWISFMFFVVQFWLLAKLFANGGMMWGVHLSYSLFHAKFLDLRGGLFPRMVKCAVDKVMLGNLHTYNLNCLLAQNFINEKVFLFLYWWYVFTIIVSFCSAVRFTMFVLLPRYQRYTTKSLLPTQEYFLDTTGGEDQLQSIGGENDLLEYFIDYLGCDGYLLLQLVGDIMHLMSVRLLARELWRRIIHKNDEEDDNEDEQKKADKQNAINSANGAGDGIPTAPPIENMDGRYYAGADRKQKSKNRKNEVPKTDEKQPLIEDRPSSSSSKSSSPRYMTQEDMFRMANEHKKHADSDSSPVFKN